MRVSCVKIPHLVPRRTSRRRGPKANFVGLAVDRQRGEGGEEGGGNERGNERTNLGSGGRAGVNGSLVECRNTSGPLHSHHFLACCREDEKRKGCRGRSVKGVLERIVASLFQFMRCCSTLRALLEFHPRLYGPIFCARYICYLGAGNGEIEMEVR